MRRWAVTWEDLWHWYRATCLVCAPFVVWAGRFHEIYRDYWRTHWRISAPAKFVAIVIVTLGYILIGPFWIMNVFLREARSPGFNQ